MSPRLHARVGAWGAALTTVILATSVLLRLGARLEGGEAVSMLPADVEFWSRLAHRIAASAVGVLAMVALVALARGGEGARARRAEIAWVVALTVLLAMVGRYTPGYRHDIVTVVNVVGGMGLAVAFVALALPAAAVERSDPAVRLALAAVTVAVGLGALADASLLWGRDGYSWPHLVAGGMAVVLSLAAAWRLRRRGAAAGFAAALAIFQAVLGLALWGERASRPLVPGWIHGLTALLLAFALLRLARAPR